MSEEILKVEDLNVNIEEKSILHNVSLSINKGETHVIMGPNGAGKSTLGHSIMGNPKFEIISGKIVFKGEDITEESVDKRALSGLYLSFQNPLEVPGISLSNFIKLAVEQKTGERLKLLSFRKGMDKTLNALSMDASYANRDLNVGFSGGEKKKSEICQLMELKPELAILDEAASRVVSDAVREYKDKNKGTLLIITHSTRILQSLEVDKVHIMVGGRIVDSGDASMIEKINNEGFESYTSETVEDKA